MQPCRTGLVIFLALSAPAFSQQKAAPKTASTKAKAQVKQVPAKPATSVQTKQIQSKQVQTKQIGAKQIQAKQIPAKTGVPPKASGTVHSAAVRRPAPRYYAQMQPTPDRYKEIQQALADRGYFKGNVDGTWGATSTDALKRFQHDQSLAEEGKIDALSLTALGLGPRRTAAASAIPPPAP
jgi:hypothetical protein